MISVIAQQTHYNTHHFNIIGVCHNRFLCGKISLRSLPRPQGNDGLHVFGLGLLSDYQDIAVPDAAFDH